MKENSHDFREIALSAAISASVGAGVALAVLLIGSAFSLLSDDPARLFVPIGLSALYLGAASCGVFAVRRTGSVLTGVFSGTALLAAVLVGGLFFRTPVAYPAPVFVLLLALIPAASALGALAGRRKKKKRPPVRRRSPVRR